MSSRGIGTHSCFGVPSLQYTSIISKHTPHRYGVKYAQLNFIPGTLMLLDRTRYFQFSTSYPLSRNRCFIRSEQPSTWSRKALKSVPSKSLQKSVIKMNRPFIVPISCFAKETFDKTGRRNGKKKKNHKQLLLPRRTAQKATLSRSLIFLPSGICYHFTQYQENEDLRMDGITLVMKVGSYSHNPE